MQRMQREASVHMRGGSSDEADAERWKGDVSEGEERQEERSQLSICEVIRVEGVG
jgi:hypothetical protein